MTGSRSLPVAEVHEKVDVFGCPRRPAPGCTMWRCCCTRDRSSWSRGPSHLGCLCLSICLHASTRPVLPVHAAPHAPVLPLPQGALEQVLIYSSFEGSPWPRAAWGLPCPLTTPCSFFPSDTSARDEARVTQGRTVAAALEMACAVWEGGVTPSSSASASIPPSSPAWCYGPV